MQSQDTVQHLWATESNNPKLPATQVYYDAVEDPSDPRSQAPSKALHAHDRLPKLATALLSTFIDRLSSVYRTVVAANSRFHVITQGILVS